VQSTSCVVGTHVFSLQTNHGTARIPAGSAVSALGQRLSFRRALSSRMQSDIDVVVEVIGGRRIEFRHRRLVRDPRRVETIADVMDHPQAHAQKQREATCKERPRDARPDDTEDDEDEPGDPADRCDAAARSRRVSDCRETRSIDVVVEVLEIMCVVRRLFPVGGSRFFVSRTHRTDARRTVVRQIEARVPATGSEQSLNRCDAVRMPILKARPRLSVSSSERRGEASRVHPKTLG
jgi:hypothetical protein